MKQAILLLLGMLLFAHAKAQPVQFSNYYRDNAYVFDDLFKLQKSEVFTTYKTQFDLTGHDEMVLDAEEYTVIDTPDNLTAFTQSRYKQYYKGYEVEGKQLNVLSKCGVVLTVTGSVLKNIEMDFTGIVSEEDALGAALDHLQPYAKIWEIAAYENALKGIGLDSNEVDSTATYYPSGKLIIAKKFGDYDDVQANYALCWKFEISYLDTVVIDTTIDTVQKIARIYVDALTGNIHTTNNNSGMNRHFTTSNVSVWTYYDGTRWGELECSVCDFNPGNICPPRLYDNRNLAVRNAREDYGLFNGDDKNWSSTEERTAASALWGVERAWDYFYNRHGRWSPEYKNNKYSPVDILVNEYNVDFAFWEEKDNIDNIHVSVDKNDKPKPTALDVMAHELTHAMIYRATKLGNDKSYTQSWAMNEGFADIFGMLTERWVRGWADWSVMESYGASSYKRNFYDPYNDKPDAHAEDYTGAYYYNDVPYGASGVLRKWFNDMSQGDWNWPVPYSGVGLDKAERITYILMTWWLWQNSGYPYAKDQSLLVAEHYYGFCSPEWKAVERAWYTVGLSGISACKYFGLRATRVAAHTQLTSVENPIKFQVKSNLLSGEIDNEIAIQSYSWILPGNWTGSYSSDNSIFILTDVSNDFSSKQVSVIVGYLDDNIYKEDTITTVLHFTTECNESSAKPSPTAIQNNTATQKPNITVYPNPASNYLNVVIPGDIKTATLELTDMAGRKVLQSDVFGGHNAVHLSNVPPGIYIMRVKNDHVNYVTRVQIKN